MSKRLFRLRVTTSALPSARAMTNNFVETFDRLAKRCREFAERIGARNEKRRRASVPLVVGFAGCEFSSCQCEQEGVKSFWLAPGAFGGRCDPNVKFGTVACKSSARETASSIGNVTDAATGLSNTASAGKYLIIEGERIRVFPEDDAELGVFFVDATGNRFRSGERLRHNDGKKVVVRVPANLAPGVYSLEIVTRFPSNDSLSSTLPQTIRYGFPLQVS